MSLQLTAEQRAQKAALKAQLRAIDKPAKDARRAERQAQRKAREADRVKFEKRPFPGGTDKVKANRGRERDPGFLAFLRRLPCVAGMVEGGCDGPIEAAHVRFSDAAKGRVNSGLQCKPSDRHAAPLCRHHHQHDQHRGSERAFWQRLGVDPGDLCPDLFTTYRAGGDGLAVLRAHVRRRAA